MSIPTPHIGATSKDQVAKTVLMPGDPLRAKFIADTFLSDVTQYNSIRGMLGFTGMYRGKRVSVQGSGMGMPSIGIYSYELFSFYDVENIIRVGTCGAASDKLRLLDIVVSVGVSYDSNFDLQYELPGKFSAAASWPLLKQVDLSAEKLGIPLRFGNTVTCDSFYWERQAMPAWAKMNVLAMEMEAAGLYMCAAAAGKNALAMMTVVDSVFTGESKSAGERERSLTDMITVALECAVAL